MLVLAAVIVIALLSRASLDRGTAQSTEHRVQAEFAARNGLEAAKKSLSTDGSGNAVSRDDLFIVTRVAPNPIPKPSAEDTTPHYYFIGQTKAGTSNVTYFPLYSGGVTQTVAVGSQPTFTAFPSGASTTAVNLPALLSDPTVAHANWPTSPLLPPVTTQWVDILNPAAGTINSPKLRYCYWVEDLGGYINADTAGNVSGKDASGTSNNTHTRDLAIMQPLIDAGAAMPTSLIAMWTVFNSTAADPSQSPQQIDNQGIVSKRSIVFTSESVKQALASSPLSPAYIAKTARHIVARTKSDSEQAVIPYGVLTQTSPPLYYANAGQPKIDLNSKINTKDVNGIADAIKTNLPIWASSRRGGFGTGLSGTVAMEDSYRRTIAANIIGYAQATADAPIVGSDYRGVGAYPLANEFYDYVNWTGTTSDSIRVEVTSWVELWNMTNQTVSGDVKYTDYYRHALDLGAFTYFDDKHDPANPDPGESVSGFPVPSQTITMAPNEYKVLSFGPVVYTLSTGGTIPPSPLTLQFRTSGRYQLEWKSTGATAFAIVDASHSGVQMQSDTIYNPQESSTHVPYKWNGCLPGFNYYGGVANFFYNPGDPRSSFYNSAPQSSNDYSSNATMWSRNQKPSSTNALAKEVKPSAWPDGGHETKSAKAGAKDTVPPSTTAPAGSNVEPSKAPAALASAGKLRSITELANIFDPAQWNIVPDANGHWTDILSTTAADAHYGGGFSLRVGRPEFSRFEKDGVRASQLLDIFAAGMRRETQGLININTATRETLRALGAGLLINRDQDIKPGTLSPPLGVPTTTDQADKFADAVIAGRNLKPFISTSQLAQLQALDPVTGNLATDAGGKPIQFFGNPQQWDSTQPPPNQAPPPSGTWEWNDAGTEEYFARTFDLTNVRSRNFRVFVTGQYVDPRYPDASGNPKVLSTVRKVYHVFLHPIRDTNPASPTYGKISSQQIDVTYERDL
jgi:hypothetical protein